MDLGISVVIPTYNRAEFLGEAIDSVTSQDYESLEVVVVDDGSTDDTQSVIAECREKSLVPIEVIQQPNAGEAAARNKGILAASYDLVAFLDSDNRWCPGKLRAQVAHLSEGGYSFSFTAYTEFGQGIDRPRTMGVQSWQDGPLYALRQLLISCCVNTSTVIAHRAVFQEAGLFDPRLVYCVDHDLWLKIATQGYAFGYLDVPLTDYRVHEGSVSQESEQVAVAGQQVIERLFRNYDLPDEIRAEEAVHLARWYLNMACRHIEAGHARDARAALWKAVTCRPASIRAGWGRMLVNAWIMERIKDPES